MLSIWTGLEFCRLVKGRNVNSLVSMHASDQCSVGEVTEMFLCGTNNFSYFL